MLAIPFGSYHTGFEYTGRSPVLLVVVTPELQWTSRYFPSGESTMFDRYLPLVKALHVDWLLRRYHFLSIPASDTSSTMVSTTHIMLALHLLCNNTPWALYVMGSICKTSCDVVSQNMSPGYGRSSYSLVGMTIMTMIYSKHSPMFFVILLHQGACSHILLYPSSLMLMHNIWDLSVWSIHCLPHSELFPYNNCRWRDQGYFRVFVYPLLFHLNHPQFSYTVQTPVGCWHLDIGIDY